MKHLNLTLLLTFCVITTLIYPVNYFFTSAIPLNGYLGGVFIAVPVISALILGIITICEEVSKKKENDPKMGTWPALREVLTPQWLSKDRVSNI